jgi:hypothetical protein
VLFRGEAKETCLNGDHKEWGLKKEEVQILKKREESEKFMMSFLA